MSDDAEKDYVHMVMETAKGMWGAEEAQRIKDHVERTAKAVYAVSNYPLEPEIEPVTKMRPGEQ
ncbi:MAG: hypothetical protein NWE89_08965 [Candidatus Bathyarchaeota archaeon]|nr:hypothetical protein [Candidatus Bathyarchaeota archaeon]